MISSSFNNISLIRVNIAMRNSLFILILCLNFSTLFAQWTNRYPKVTGTSHHIYLEGYELPTLSMGPIDPAVSPDNSTIAFSSRGWIWFFDIETGVAKRLTKNGPMDFRPTWSPDGSRLAFIRDNGSDTWIVIYDIMSGKEDVINSPALELDPAFSDDGRFLFYASARNGTIDIWKHEFATKHDSIIIEESGTQLSPQPHPDGDRLIYMHKARSNDIRVHWLAKDEEINSASVIDKELTVLQTERIASMTRPALSPNGDLVVYNWPTQEGYELRLLNIFDPTTTVLLTSSDGLPLTPAWGADGKWIYFAEADNDEVFVLKRISVYGGDVESINILSWDWGEPTATLRLKTKMKGSNKLIPSRISVRDGKGHFVIPDKSQSRFDGQNGYVFFYSPGIIELTVPIGAVEISVVQGLSTPELIKNINVKRTGVKEVSVSLKSIWDPRDEGWISGDHHFHLNYGGQYQLTPEDLLPMMAGEALDVATPLLANLHNRFEDQKYWGWKSSDNEPLIFFAQEIRSHFLGHLGLLGNKDLFWPWIWGPGYQVYNSDDRPNAEALQFAREQGGLSLYVHPIMGGPNPISEEGRRRVPVELVADGVLDQFDLLEVACLWSDEIGTSRLWYRFLNIGVPITPSGGTDVMNNLYRTMAIGTTRVYAYTAGAKDWSSYADALKDGRTFVTNGPMLDFNVENSIPGGIVSPSRRVKWTLDLHSAIGVDTVEVVINGRIVWSSKGLDKPGSHSYRGSVMLPAGGWIAARAIGGEISWPAMDSYPFAHTAPIWIGSVGSTDSETRRTAAMELISILDISEQRLKEGYLGIPIPKLQAQFNKARKRLEDLKK
jgi:TolB protein